MQRKDYLLGETQELFNRVDDDGDGRIDFDEFKELLLELDDRRSADACFVAFCAIDTNNDGHIGFDELRNWWRQHHSAAA
jgi:Ca2+-binding EF-hand superfamily protein